MSIAGIGIPNWAVSPATITPAAGRPLLFVAASGAESPAASDSEGMAATSASDSRDQGPSESHIEAGGEQFTDAGGGPHPGRTEVVVESASATEEPQPIAPKADPPGAEVLLWLALAVAVLTWWSTRGHFSGRAFLRAPQRPASLSPLDLLIAAALYLMGLASLSMLNAATGIVPVDDEGRITGAGMAVLSWLEPVIVKGPIVAYALFRVAQVGAGLGDGQPSVAGSSSEPQRAAGRARRAIGRFGLSTRRIGVQLLHGVRAFAGFVPIYFAVGGLTMIIADWLGHPMPPIAHRTLEAIVAPESAAAQVALILAVVLAAPLVEELIFRGLMQTALLHVLGPARRWSVILLAAGFFAVIHLGVAPVLALPSLAALGVLLGWLYERTGSLWPCIVVHALFNAGNVALAIAQHSTSATG